MMHIILAALLSLSLLETTPLSTMARSGTRQAPRYLLVVAEIYDVHQTWRRVDGRCGSL